MHTRGVPQPGHPGAWPRLRGVGRRGVPERTTKAPRSSNNEFGEAANDPLHSGALIAAGLVLFVLTLLVNAAARWVVRRGAPA
jgi:hypothetical protein